MKKSDFITLITYTVSTLVLALGMCMFTLPDWHLQNIGLPVAIVGLLLEVISWVIQRRLAGKGAPNVNPKLVGKVVYYQIFYPDEFVHHGRHKQIEGGSSYNQNTEQGAENGYDPVLEP
jgi:hypothetical protein